MKKLMVCHLICIGLLVAPVIFAGEAVRPLALASGDFDEDGVPDLVCGYASPAGGFVTVHRGNVDSIYPHGRAARNRRATGTFTDAPFLLPTTTVGVPGAPELLGAGDFDGDGHLDLVAASVGNGHLEFLRGDGNGSFIAGPPVIVPGAVTALAAGEINRADGLVDVIVALDGDEGPAVAIFEGPRGALRSEPEVLEIPAPAADLALGVLDDDAWIDLVLGTGHELTIVHGRDRRLSIDDGPGAEDSSPVLERMPLPWAIGAVAVGEFRAERDRRQEIAVLSEGGDLRYLWRDASRQGPGEIEFPSTRPSAATSIRLTQGWSMSEGRRIEASAAAGSASRAIRRILLPVRVSGGSSEDLLVLDPAAGGLRFTAENDPGRDLDETFGAASAKLAGQPVAVLPMRLNADALTDLVILQEGVIEPAVAMSVTQAVITVDTAADDDTPGDGNCSLREAMANADFNGDTTDGDCAAGIGIDAIEFAIGGGGAVATIGLTQELPTIKDVVTIDGTTQGCLGPPCIELDGTLAGNNRDGLVIDSGGTTVRGLVIHSFEGHGILITAPGNVIEGNYIGTDVTGAIDRGNQQDGVAIQSAPSNTVGGTTPQARNIISGNDDEGVSIVSVATTGTQVRGNYIGTDLSGTLALGNGSDGVVVDDAPNTVVGGVVPGVRNVVSGNGDDGIYVVSGESTGVRIQGNHIGTDVNGVADLGNIDDGIEVRGAPGNTIGGTSAEARNVISGNDGDGVAVTFGATETRVQGNYLGTDVSGAADLGNGDDGVEIREASENTVGGLTVGARNVISGNDDEGVTLASGATENLVQGNFIGTDASGLLGLGNEADGIVISGSPNNTIGGLLPGSRNVVSGNLDEGIVISAVGSTGNRIEGNFIGTDPDGTAALGNLDNGIEIRDASGNTVGGLTVEARNIISGNEGDGIVIAATATGNQVQGNYIGADVGGFAALGNLDDGIEIQGAPANTIGGTSAEARNVISGNGGDGVVLSSGATGNRVEGNFIGTDPNGTAALGNLDDGIHLQDAIDNTVGGTSAGAGNLISGNGDDGVHFFSPGATGNRVQGNLIGTDVSGTADLGNANDGVEIRESQGNTIGGLSAEARNVISGNEGDGVVVTLGATGNQVQGNFIGTNVSGSPGLGNTINGVLVLDATGNTIGGAIQGAGNLIRSSGGNGVLVAGISSAMILRNSIGLNAQLGIALGSGTVLPNDTGDADIGPNDLQNYPVLSGAVAGPFGTTVEGTLNSLGSTEFRLEFFSSPFCDPSGHGEGASYLGSFDVTTGPIGNTSFARTVSGLASSGDSITATATGVSSGVTSEFSACASAGLHCTPVLSVGKSGTDALLSWIGPPTASLFDLVRGSLVALKASEGDFSAATDACMGDDEPCCGFTNTGIPASGDAFWFLVRGDDCQASSYDSGGPAQVGSRDGGIGASGNDCP